MVDKHFWSNYNVACDKLLDTRFGRSLPPPKALGDPNIRFILSDVVHHQGLLRSSIGQENLLAALDTCFQRGWLHAELEGNDSIYCFPSPLHAWYIAHPRVWLRCCRVSFILHGSRYCAVKLLPHQDHSPDHTYLPQAVQELLTTPLSLGINIIQKFSPKYMAGMMRYTYPDGEVNFPESHFSHEFYRCAHILLQGFILPSPSFGNKGQKMGGAIDFIIPIAPGCAWGYEFVYSGDRPKLEEHLGRFKPEGPYESLMEKGDITDYIVFDFRTSLPDGPFTGM